MRLLKLIPDDTNVDWMRWRNVAALLSLALLIASVALLATRGLNLGVDFKGGQMIRASFAQPPQLDTIRSRVSALGLGEPTIQEFGDPRTITIRMPLPTRETAQSAADVERVKDAVQQVEPTVSFQSVETVLGKVSQELQEDGALAILLAMLGIGIYIWFRFEWQFGVGALSTLVHDVILTLGFFALTQLEFNLNVVAAILTIVGYSLNDTVVIYDRIRENLRKYRKMEIVPLINLSINETLSRTIVTSLSIILALLILLFFGPDVIFGLAAAILFGAIIGTYSTIYISSPFLIWLKVNSDSFLPKSAGPASAERVTSHNERF